MSKTYNYPEKEVKKEYYRSGVGMLISGVPLLLFGPSSVIVSILGCFFCLFLAYGVRAYYRGRMHLILGSRAIEVKGLTEKTILWEELEELKLSYYSTRRDGEKGWMQLRLKAKGVRLRVESTITDFWDLVDTCALIAKDRGLLLDSSTIRNMRTLGIETDAIGYQQIRDWGKE